jgi:hypothetical protein
MGDFLIDLIVVDPNDGDITAFTLGLALYIPVTIGVNTIDNTISLAFAQEIPLEIQVLHEEVNFNDTAFEEFVPMILEFVLPLLGSIINDFPIPAFSGYTFDVNSLSAIGSRNDWMGLFGDLSAAVKK